MYSYSICTGICEQYEKVDTLLDFHILMKNKSRLKGMAHKWNGLGHRMKIERERDEKEEWIIEKVSYRRIEARKRSTSARVARSKIELKSAWS